MCGITGIIKKYGVNTGVELKAMCDRIVVRGPDAEGFFVEDSIGLGHRRLSVIDLATGSQPMFDTSGQIVIVFNGEIYNFQSLRDELIQLGYSFQTTSDTEVLINGYKQYGIKGLLDRIEGMFAFALYDRNTGKVFVARDKFGEKPLYYYDDSQQIVFASELKAFDEQIQKQIDPIGLNLFFTLTYIPAPYTIYKDVRKLPAGSYMEIGKKGSFEIHAYYDVLQKISTKERYQDFSKAQEDLKHLLYTSVKERMIADVPIGAFLSGGIDSSIIASVMAQISDKPINTFSIGFKEKEYDESDRAQLVADKIKSNHTVHYLDYNDVVSFVDDIILYYDEPFGDSSAIPSYYVAKLARQKVTVVLTGDCADELFGGYEKYLAQWYVSKLKKLPASMKWFMRTFISLVPHTRLTNSFLRKAKKVVNNIDCSDFDLHYSLMSLGFNDAERKNLLLSSNFAEVKSEVEKVYNKYTAGESLEKGFYTDLKVVLEGDMLVKVDRVCMKNSLEARVPFLDSKIVEAAYTMPVDYKIKGKEKKYILKETFKDLLPEETVNFSKKGFGVPVDYWFKNELRDELGKLLDKELIIRQNIFNYDVIKKLWDEHMSGKENHKGKLWNLYVFQKWYLSKIEKHSS